MNRLKMLAAAMVVVLCCGGGAFAAPKKVVVATDATWPPMEMVDKDKKIVGFDIDFMTAVAKEAGFEVEFKNTAWDGIFAGLEAGKYDAIISSVTITPERQKQYDFSLPYIDAGQILVVPKVSTATKLADLAGKKVGAQIGTTGAFQVKKSKGVELKSYDEVGLAFEDMAAGRIQGVVCDEPTAIIYALKKEEYKSKFKIVGKPFTKEAYGIVVKKGNKELVDLINRGITRVKGKKLDVAMKKKWLN